MWNVMPYADFKRLILNYDTINFEKYEVSIFQQAQNNKVAQAIFDSLVKTYYIHYHQDDSYEQPKIKSIDVFAKDIATYTEDAIKRRLNRMHQENERPIFIFETRDRERYNGIYTETDINDFIKLKTEYTKILLVTKLQFKDYPEMISDCHILYYEDKYLNIPPNTENMALTVFNKFK